TAIGDQYPPNPNLIRTDAGSLRSGARTALRRFRDAPAGPVGVERVLVQLHDLVASIADGDVRSDIAELRGIDLRASGDDQLVADLTGTRRGPVQHAAAAAALPVDHIRGEPRPGRLVPDLDELERQQPDQLAVLGIERDGPLVVQIGSRYPEAVQLGDHDGAFHRGTSIGAAAAAPGRLQRPAVMAPGRPTAGTRTVAAPPSAGKGPFRTAASIHTRRPPPDALRPGQCRLFGSQRLPQLDPIDLVGAGL